MRIPLTPLSDERSTRGLGTALVVCSAAGFATLAVFGRLALDHGLDVPTMLALRFALATAVLLALGRLRPSPPPRRRGQIIRLLLLGGLLYTAMTGAFFTALRFTPAASVATLFYVYPAVVAVAEHLRGRQRLTGVTSLAVALALCGSALTAGAFAVRGAQPVGLALALCAGVAYAGYVVASPRAVAGVGALPATTLLASSSAAVFVLVALGAGPAWPTDGVGWAAVAGLALISTVAALVTFFAGVKRLGPSDTATLSTLEPMVAVVLAAVLLGEQVTLLQVLGGLLIVAAAVLVARGGRPRAARRYGQAHERSQSVG